MIFNSVQFNPVMKLAAVGRAAEEGMRGLVEEKAAQTTSFSSLRLPDDAEGYINYFEPTHVISHVSF